MLQFLIIEKNSLQKKKLKSMLLKLALTLPKNTDIVASIYKFTNNSHYVVEFYQIYKNFKHPMLGIRIYKKSRSYLCK